MEPETDQELLMERIVAEVPSKLKSLFKMALIYEGKNMKDKLTELIEAYTYSIIRIGDETPHDGKPPLQLSVEEK